MGRNARGTGSRCRLIGLGGFALTAGLAVFHGGLLWQRLTDGSLLQPVVVVRWAVSALLVLALYRLWSRGLPVVRGRRAGVLWMVVVLLHAISPGGAALEAEPVAEGVLPAALAILAFLALGLAAALIDRPLPFRRSRPRRRAGSRRAGVGWFPVLFSRPPPVSLHS